MCDLTSANTERAQTEQPPRARREASSRPWREAAELLLSAPAVGSGYRAHPRARVDPSVRERETDVSRSCETEPSQDRRGPTARRTMFAGRALSSRGTAGEPNSGVRAWPARSRGDGARRASEGLVRPDGVAAGAGRDVAYLPLPRGVDRLD
jgi:hypothetical protein